VAAQCRSAACALMEASGCICMRACRGCTTRRASGCSVSHPWLSLRRARTRQRTCWRSGKRWTPCCSRCARACMYVCVCAPGAVCGCACVCCPCAHFGGCVRAGSVRGLASLGGAAAGRVPATAACASPRVVLPRACWWCAWARACCRRAPTRWNQGPTVHSGSLLHMLAPCSRWVLGARSWHQSWVCYCRGHWRLQVQAQNSRPSKCET